MAQTITTSHAAPAPVQTGAVHAKDVSVIVCAYTDERWDDLLAAVASLRAQTAVPGEIILVIDHNDDLHARRAPRRPRASSRSPTSSSAASPARATAASPSPRASVVAFLDDDAVAEPDWLERMLTRLRRPGRDRGRRPGRAAPGTADAPRPSRTSSTGSWAAPTAACPRRPRRCATRSARTCPSAARSSRPSAASRTASAASASAPSAARRRSSASARRPASPRASSSTSRPRRVHHRVPAAARRWRYFRARCYAEGLSKALVTPARRRAAPPWPPSAPTRCGPCPRACARGVRDAPARRRRRPLAGRRTSSPASS